MILFQMRNELIKALPLMAISEAGPVRGLPLVDAIKQWLSFFPITSIKRKRMTDYEASEP